MLELSNRRRGAAKCHFLYTNGQARGWHGEGRLSLASRPSPMTEFRKTHQKDRVIMSCSLSRPMTYGMKLEGFACTHRTGGYIQVTIIFIRPSSLGIKMSCWEMWAFCWNCDCLEHTQLTDGRQRSGLRSIWKLSVGILLVTIGIYGNCPFLSSLQTPLCYTEKREKLWIMCLLIADGTG